MNTKSLARHRGLAAWASVMLAAGCGGGGGPRAAVPPPVAVAGGTTTAAASTTPPTGSPAVDGSPAAQRAQSLREAADLLDKATKALASGNRDLADLLFSSAELLAGAAALAEIAPAFREGGPPRIDTPLVKIPDAGPAPAVLGNSDEEDAEEAKTDPAPKPPERGSLEGNVLVGGKVAAGALAVITLEPASGKWKPRKPKQRLMEQRDREFAPKLIAVSTGSTVSFPNYDKVFHNVFSTTGMQPFDLGIYKEGDARSVTFTKEGIYRIGCNLHANMSAHIAVVSQPHFVVANSDGSFKFSSVAPGKWKMKIWSDRAAQPVVQEITIKAGKNNISAAVSDDAPKGPAPNKFGKARAN